MIKKSTFSFFLGMAMMILGGCLLSFTLPSVDALTFAQVTVGAVVVIAACFFLAAFGFILTVLSLIDHFGDNY